MNIELKPCPACGNDGLLFGQRDWCTYAVCTNDKCCVHGPLYDTDGSKWNALPRRDDVKNQPDEGALLNHITTAYFLLGPVLRNNHSPESMVEVYKHLREKIKAVMT